MVAEEIQVLVMDSSVDLCFFESFAVCCLKLGVMLVPWPTWQPRN